MDDPLMFYSKHACEVRCVDHAGHLGGAHSPTMARKQREMDELVQLVQGTIEDDQQASACMYMNSHNYVYI